MFTIRRLAREYSFINVVPVFIYTDRHAVEQRLGSAAGPLTGEGVDPRMERSFAPLDDYFDDPSAYREVLINDLSEPRLTNVAQRLLEKYQASPSIDPYLIAVLMSFSPDSPELRDCFSAMQAAAHALSSHYRCERLDDLPSSEPITSAFEALVSRARCAIVDITENKQNVYYELGFAQARGMTCIIVARVGTAPAFYAARHRILLYNSPDHLREQLTAELSRLIRGPAGL